MKLRYILFFLVIFFTSFSPIILGLTAKPADVTFYWARERIRARNLPALMQEVEPELELSMYVGKQGNTVLHAAAMLSKDYIIDYLLEAGCEVNVKNDLGETPLHIAIKKKHMGIVESLLKAGADVNAQDINGNTPLHIAAITAYPEKLLYLLGGEWTFGESEWLSFTSFKADISIKNKKGFTVGGLLNQLIKRYQANLYNGPTCFVYYTKCLIDSKVMLYYLMKYSLFYYNSFA